MVTTALLTLIGAVGLARVVRAGDGRKRAPRGLRLFGLGVAAAGLLRADPMEGFAQVIPSGPPTEVTWHGLGHLAAGGVGLLGLIVAALLMARWFGRMGLHGWQTFSLVTELFYLGLRPPP